MKAHPDVSVTARDSGFRTFAAPGDRLIRPTRSAVSSSQIEIARATEADREVIDRVRHRVYAEELRQHQTNEEGVLRDSLDAFNTCLVARLDVAIAGFISITPPGGGRYSIDKYFRRDEFPFPFDERLYEVRLLTVVDEHRGRQIAGQLMYAALRWVEAHGGTRIVGIGRREVMSLYRKAGLELLGLSIRAGAVTYEAMQGEVAELRRRLAPFDALLRRLETRVQWRLDVPFRKPAACFHGGAFFEAIGERFDALERRDEIINADVLDAWFPPAPRVLEVLRRELDWLARTSPPTSCAGLVSAIAGVRDVPEDSILTGGGSSDLIYLALPRWLTADSRVLLLDPTYGEYAHVLERVIGCAVDRLVLDGGEDYTVNLERLEEALRRKHDMVILVNPNSPTGRHAPADAMREVLRRAPVETRVWVDETYVEYAGPGQSLESLAATSENVIVCKSMSKVYALSGLRVAYLCAGPHQLEPLRAWTPPWAVGLPGQVAAVEALKEPGYYAARYRETHVLREELAVRLGGLGLRVIPGVANFLLCHLPEEAPEASAVVQACRREGLFLRDASPMGTALGRRALRIAVKDGGTNDRMIEVLGAVLRRMEPGVGARFVENAVG